MSSVVVEYLGVADEGPMHGYSVFKVGSQKIAVAGRPGNLSFWKVQKGRLVSHFFRDKSVFNRILQAMMDIRKETSRKEPPKKTWKPTAEVAPPITQELETSEGGQRTFWWNDKD